MTLLFFFFNDTATTEIYTLSLHDALPIYQDREDRDNLKQVSKQALAWSVGQAPLFRGGRVNPGLQALGGSEEHTSELQSPCNLVCRLLLEKKKKKKKLMDTNHIEVLISGL